MSCRFMQESNPPVGEQEREVEPSGATEGTLGSLCDFLLFSRCTYLPGSHNHIILQWPVLLPRPQSQRSLIPRCHSSEATPPGISSPSFSWVGSPAFPGSPGKALAAATYSSDIQMVPDLRWFNLRLFILMMVGKRYAFNRNHTLHFLLFWG